MKRRSPARQVPCAIKDYTRGSGLPETIAAVSCSKLQLVTENGRHVAQTLLLVLVVVIRIVSDCSIENQTVSSGVEKVHSSAVLLPGNTTMNGQQKNLQCHGPMTKGGFDHSTHFRFQLPALPAPAQHNQAVKARASLIPLMITTRLTIANKQIVEKLMLSCGKSRTRLTSGATPPDYASGTITRAYTSLTKNKVHHGKKRKRDEAMSPVHMGTSTSDVLQKGTAHALTAVCFSSPSCAGIQQNTDHGVHTVVVGAVLQRRRHMQRGPGLGSRASHCMHAAPAVVRMDSHCVRNQPGT